MKIRKYIAKAIQACFITNVLFAGEADIKAFKDFESAPNYEPATHHFYIAQQIKDQKIREIIWSYLGNKDESQALISAQLSPGYTKYFSLIPSCIPLYRDRTKMIILRKDQAGKLQTIVLKQNVDENISSLHAELLTLQAADHTLTSAYIDQICFTMQAVHGHLNYRAYAWRKGNENLFSIPIRLLLTLNTSLIENQSIPHIAGILSNRGVFAIDDNLGLAELEKLLKAEVRRAYEQFRTELGRLLDNAYEQNRPVLSDSEMSVFKQMLTALSQFQLATFLPSLTQAAADPSRSTQLLITGRVTDSLEEVRPKLFPHTLSPD